MVPDFAAAVEVVAEELSFSEWAVGARPCGMWGMFVGAGTMNASSLCGICGCMEVSYKTLSCLHDILYTHYPLQKTKAFYSNKCH